MPSIGGRNLEKTFMGKMHAERDETDHARFVWKVDGRTVLTTELFPRRLRAISAPGLIGQIARVQLLLPGGAPALAKLVNCTMSEGEWRDHVKAVAERDTRRRL